jgi:acyl-ACP thioesterase
VGSTAGRAGRYNARMLDEQLVPLPDVGRVFRAGRRVRLGDADVEGRLRLDACARYLQDIGNDDTAEAGTDVQGSNWVVRRAVVDVVAPPRWREWVDLATWCGGTGRRWAERRLSLRGERGGSVEVATLWVHVDLATMAPARLPDSFTSTYAESALGRKVTSRRWVDGPVPDDAAAVAWPLRATDLDLLRHVNNAAYWEAVEEQLLGGPLAVRPGGGPHPLLAAPYRAVMEYGAGLAPAASVDVRVTQSDEHLSLWFMSGGAVDTWVTVLPLATA